jgi:hypothetical protein
MPWHGICKYFIIQDLLILHHAMTTYEGPPPCIVKVDTSFCVNSDVSKGGGGGGKLGHMRTTYYMHANIAIPGG